jgi:putative ABC transport system permease protein
LLAEALLMALVGAIVGVGFGVLYGFATTRVLFSNGVHAVITIPVGQLLVYVALAAAAGVVAAVLPAHRAAQTSVVTAIADT